jgi:hypothetical protein
VSAVRNQNPYGTCWSFAAMASLESALLPGVAVDFSEDNMALQSGYGFGNPYNHGGNDNMATAYLTRWAGPVDEASDPYGDGATPSGLTAVRHLQEVRWIPAAYGTDNQALKQAVVDTGAVSVSVYWSGAYYNSANKAFYVPSGAASWTNHAVAVVGWDDSYPRTRFNTQPPGDGAWLVRNSWGAGWGNQGYFWASYYDAFIGDEPWAYCGVEPADNYDTVYQYDTLGLVSSWGYGTQTAWFANHFVAGAEEQLAAVSFWALTPGTSYEIWVGADLQQPDVGAMDRLATGAVTYAGYRTISLDGGLSLQAGEHFVVAVKATTPGTAYPVPIEMRWSGYSDLSTGDPGQSFISSTGSSWSDFENAGLEGSVCLKAFTTGGAASEDPVLDDVTPPLTVDDADAAWHNDNVVVTLDADDGDGSGVALTELSVDGGGWIAAPEAGHGEVTVEAPADHSGDGVHTVAYRSTDEAGNQEATKTCKVKIDTRRPTTVVLNRATVQRGRTPTARFRINDGRPTCGRAAATIVISRRSGAVVRRLRLSGAVRTNADLAYRLARKLPRGIYTVRVLATDAAGNRQQAALARRLVVL